MIWGAIDIERPIDDDDFCPSFSLPFAGIEPLFSLLWAWGSFKLLPMLDESRKLGVQARQGHSSDVAAGAFEGTTLAPPSFGLYMSCVGPGEDRSGGSNLGDYRRCEIA